METPRTPINHNRKLLLGLSITLLVPIAAGVALLSRSDWNAARPYLNRQLSKALHRQVAIEGDLTLQWQQPEGTEAGWRAWLPWPQLTAKEIRISNPAWMNTEPAMGRIGLLSITLDPWPLLARTARLTHLRLEDTHVDLLRNAEGRNNWALEETDPESTADNNSDAPSAWRVDVQQIALQNVAISLADPSSRLAVSASLNSLAAPTPEAYGIAWQAEGKYNKGVIKGEGMAGSLLSLTQDSAPYPVKAALRVGGTTIQFDGAVTRPADLAALDVQLRLGGPTMSDLNPLLGVALPNTPPYATQGRLVGKLDRKRPNWRYENFKGKVGSSDLSGTLEFQIQRPRPLLTGSVESSLLRLKDLGPIIGLDKRLEAQGKKRQPPEKALPVDEFDTASWNRMDAKVQFVGKKLLHDKDLPLDNIKADIALTDKILTLEPLNFGVAGGTVSSQITMDGQGGEIKARMRSSVRHLKLRKLVPAAESMQASLGEVYGDISLSGHGNSIARMLATSNGEFKALVSKGTISRFLLEAAGLNVGNIVLVKLFGDKQVVLNCLAADFSVRNGLARARDFKLDTEDAVIDITGDVNLATEKLNLDIHPESKSLRIFTLRTPLYVQGTFKKPDVGVKAGPMAARAGAAVALGILATPLAALIPLLSPGTTEADACGPLLKAAAGKAR